MREGFSPRGRRGYEVRVLSSTDGVQFEPVASIRREDVPIPGFERPALVRDPAGGAFRLYVCGPWRDGPWCILKLDDVAAPADLDAASARPVLTPAGCGIAEVESLKDPFIVHAEGRWHMLVIGLAEGAERTFHFVSDDGLEWGPATLGRAFDCGGWHDFFTRPACLVSMERALPALPGVAAGEWLFVYEGSAADWHDPVYNIATGLARSGDLERFEDLSPNRPVLRSRTPGTYHTWRYSHWLWVDAPAGGRELWAYAEVACPNDTNEVRLFRLGSE
jgi:hypothetical protein